MVKQVRNRYSGSAGITQREADTIKGSIRKLTKIRNKKNLYIRHVYFIDQAIVDLDKVLQEADRQ